MWGGDAATVGTPEVNAPSLWSGGIRWDGAAPEAGYWQSSANPTDRTGVPDISIAIGGELSLSVCRSASWSLGRQEWLSVLQPAGASLEIEGAVTFDPMTEVVIGVMSDTTDQHSASLWVGYAETLSETTDASGRVTTNVSCVDVIGRLGQARMPSGSWTGTLAEVVEAIGLELAVPLQVIDEGRGYEYPVGGTRTSGETALSFVNRCEQGSNALLALRGDGRLEAVHRVAILPEDVPTPTPLTGSDIAADWTRERSPTNVVNWWGDAGWDTTAAAASRRSYGPRTYEPDRSLELLDSWVDLIFSDILVTPRWQLASARFPIKDLGQPALFLDPLGWVTLDGTDWQVMSVQHDVRPGHSWTTTITADQTQAGLFGVYEEA